MHIIFSDLDGSLHHRDHGFHPQDLHTLHRLPEHQVLRVIATGRSLYSAQQILTPAFPIDYLIFSSGAGILHWPTQKLIYSAHLNPEDISPLLQFFEQHQLDFFLHGEVPDNHYFWCHRFSEENTDYETRRQLYPGLDQPLTPPLRHWPENAPCSQAIIFVSAERTEATHHLLTTQLPHLSIIRSTSPFDKKSAWLEIFPAQVSKSQSAQWLQRHLNAHQGFASMAFGNDYNDSDLLAWADAGYVVTSAPADLKAHHTEVSDPHQAGFTAAFKQWQAHFLQDHPAL